MKRNRHGPTSRGMNAGGSLTAERIDALLADHRRTLEALVAPPKAEEQQTPEQFKRYALGRTVLADALVPVQSGLRAAADQAGHRFEVPPRTPRIVYVAAIEASAKRGGFRFPPGGGEEALRQRYIAGEIDAALGRAQFGLVFEGNTSLELKIRSGKNCNKSVGGLAISAVVHNPDTALLGERDQVRKSLSSKPAADPAFYIWLGDLYGHTRESAEEFVASTQELVPEALTLSALAFLPTQPDLEYITRFSQPSTGEV